ncbi:MAG: FdtA/QdtA family cupin domain-containing protein [Turicibacter sanguinis]
MVPLDGDDFPFEVKRVFYLVDVKQGMTRGNHAYYKSEQVLICLHGSVKVRCNETIYELNHPKVGLYLAPEVWREAFDFSERAVLLAVSSEPFCESDYRY